MMKKYLLIGALALFVIVLVSWPAAAEDRTFTAFGTVIDEADHPVPGANVTLIDGDYRNLSVTTTDTNGNFRFTNIGMPGSHMATVVVNRSIDGIIYKVSLSDSRWYDVSSGIVEFDSNNTRIHGYPPSDHGYAWGSVRNGTINGPALDATVFLVNNTTALTANTTANGTFEIMAAVGDYQIYALHKAGDSWLMSEMVPVTIRPSFNRLDVPPVTLVGSTVTVSPPSTPTPKASPVSQEIAPPEVTVLPPPAVTPAPSTSQPVSWLPLAVALALGVVLIIAVWALLRRRQ